MSSRGTGLRLDDLTGEPFGVDEDDRFCRQFFRRAGPRCREVVKQNSGRFGVKRHVERSPEQIDAAACERWRVIWILPVGTAEGVDLPSLRAAIENTERPAVESAGLLDANDFAGVMLLLAAAPLPECQAWGPSSLYRQAYADVARKLIELEDARRADVGKWIGHSLAMFADAKGALDQWLTDANASLETNWAAALAPLEEAQKTFNTELARLGAH